MVSTNNYPTREAIKDFSNTLDKLIRQIDTVKIVRECARVAEDQQRVDMCDESIEQIHHAIHYALKARSILEEDEF